MSDDFDLGGDSGDAAADPAAAAIGLALGAAGADPSIAADARTFLRRQSRYLELQMEDLHEQRDLTLSHLRWRRFNDWMRAAWQASLAIAAVSVVLVVAIAMWSARDAKGLVVRPLKTPPDFVARGLDGTVLAQRLLDRLNILVADSDTFAYRSANSIRGDWGNESRVEIPETGVSIAEFNRELRSWLGGETYVSGEIWHAADGIAVTVRSGGNPGVTARGGDIDALLDRAAESVLEQTQPYRYAALLQQRGRYDDLLAFVSRIARTGAPPDRAWAYQFWSNTLGVLGRNREAIPIAKKAFALDPSDPSILFVLGGFHIFLGHESEVIANDVPFKRLLSNPQGISATALAGMRAMESEAYCANTGDFQCAFSATEQMGVTSFYGYNSYADLLAASQEARRHDANAAVSLLAGHPDWTDATAIEQSANNDLQLPFFFVLAERGDWDRAAAELSAADFRTRSKPGVTDIRHTFVWPWLAYALARSGRATAAQRLAGITPSDCTLCVAMRGRIAVLRRDRASADVWFGRATRDAPEWPFSWTYWGEALLSLGDVDAAIAKFEVAHQKGPRFADPLELWGEALVAKNRSDLALAKFEDANRYAPNWGRLHLKWGEALAWLGRKDDARKQFALAATLDLSKADAAALADMRSVLR